MISAVTGYLNEFASADLRGVVVVGEGHAQLASFQVHSGLEIQGFNLLESLIIIFSNVCEVFDTDLEFLPSDGLHVAFLADGEGVGDLCICGVDLGPREGVTVLGHLCDQLVVAAFLNDVIRDTCEERWVVEHTHRHTFGKLPEAVQVIRGMKGSVCFSHQAVCRTHHIPPGSQFPIFR